MKEKSVLRNHFSRAQKHGCPMMNSWLKIDHCQRERDMQRKKGKRRKKKRNTSTERAVCVCLCVSNCVADRHCAAKAFSLFSFPFLVSFFPAFTNSSLTRLLSQYVVYVRSKSAYLYWWWSYVCMQLATVRHQNNTTVPQQKRKERYTKCPAAGLISALACVSSYHCSKACFRFLSLSFCFVFQLYRLLSGFHVFVQKAVTARPVARARNMTDGLPMASLNDFLMNIGLLTELLCR